MNSIEIDLLIEQLNLKENISDVTIENISVSSLSESEKLFIKEHYPQKALIIYGTLAPGKPNHTKIQHIKGEWRLAVVKGGRLESKGWGAEMGYNGFVPVNAVEQQTDIPAHVLFSEQLVSNWQFLDQFEGEGYRRILARYELQDGQYGIGYIYAINNLLR